MLGVTADSFASVEDLAAHLNRTRTSDSDFDAKAISALNAAANTLRVATSRTLRAVTYRLPQSIDALTAITGDDPSTATLSGVAGVFSSGIVKQYDAVASDAIGFETRVLSVTDDTVTVGPWIGDPNASLAPATYTFGSDAMILSGDGTNELNSDEWPVIAVHSAASWTGAEWFPIDIGGIRYGSDSLWLANDAWPDGERNIRVELTAGYEEPRGNTVGHPREWRELKRLTLRLAEMHFLGDQSLRGRSKTLTGPGGSVQVESALPDDVAALVWQYARLA